MITGEFKSWRSQGLIFSNPILNRTFTWVEKNIDKLSICDYNLPFGDCFAKVMEYDLREREQARFESHKKNIDLQISLINGEGIEWAPVSQLKKDQEYDVNTDFQFYEIPKNEFGFIKNRVGIFTLLFPEDGHQPQRIIDNFSWVRKLVVKIPQKNFKI